MIFALSFVFKNIPKKILQNLSFFIFVFQASNRFRAFHNLKKSAAKYSFAQDGALQHSMLHTEKGRLTEEITTNNVSQNNIHVPKTLLLELY